MIEVEAQNTIVIPINCYSIPRRDNAIPILNIIGQITHHKQYHITFYSSLNFVNQIKHLYPNVQMIGVNDDFINQNNQQSMIYDQQLRECWKHHFSTIQHQPNLIFTDYAFYGAIQYAKKNNIKLVINYPNTLQSLIYLSNIFECRKLWKVGGISFYHPNPIIQFKSKYYSHNQIIRKNNQSLILINSYFGIDDPIILPPNFLLIGPHLKFQDQQLPIDLIDWIKSMKSIDKQHFLYVNLGSNYKYSNKFIKTLYQGLKQTKIPVIWNFNSQIPEYMVETTFYIKKQLSQQAILSLPQIKLTIINDSWSAINQSIHYKKLIILVSFGNNQLSNAQMLKSKKIALILASKQQSQDSLTTQNVFRAIKKVQVDPRYAYSIMKINKLSLIEQQQKLGKYALIKSIQVGHQHLIDNSYNTTNNSKILDSIKLLALVGTSVALFINRQWVVKKLKLLYERKN